MEAQKPAEGITITHDYGDSKMYAVLCDCGDPTHRHDVCVEAEDTGITVTTYTEQTTDYWYEYSKKSYDIDNDFIQGLHWWWKDIINGFVNRLRLTRDIWFKGYIKYQASIIMSQQQALNYSEVLKQAIKDVEDFRSIRVEPKD